MIKSMTGFGRCEHVQGDRKFTVEIKAVNHRYFDVNIKMPKKFNFFESAIRSVFVGGVGWISPQDVKKQRHLPLVLSYRVDGMSKDGAYLSLELEPWEYDLLLEQTKNHYKNKEKRNTK